MNVLCNNDRGWSHGGKVVDGPKYMERCTVVNESSDGYELAEYVGEIDGASIYYVKTLFIPLSDKDETEYAEGILEKIFVPIEK